MGLYRGDTSLRRLKQCVIQALDCGEIGLGCNHTECLKQEELYQDKPYVNVTFGKTQNIKRENIQPKGQKLKLGDDPKGACGYRVKTSATVDIYAQQCDVDDAFLQASQVESWVLAQMQNGIGVKNADWLDTDSVFISSGEKKIAWFSMKFEFEYQRLTNQADHFGGCINDDSNV